MPNTIECNDTWPEGTASRAIYSDGDNKKYRYLLERIWDETLPVLMFVMSHASKATVRSNDGDATVAKCEERARKHHLPTGTPLCFGRQEFGGVCITNIFAFIQTEENPLSGETHPIGTENFEIIEEYARRDNIVVVCAWGSKCNHTLFLGQTEIIKPKLRETGAPLNYFGFTQARQQPKHVSRRSDECNFRPW